MNEFRDLKFVCPKCGRTELSMKQAVTEYVEIIGTDVCGLTQGDVLDGSVDEEGRYACHACGYVVGENEDEALQWLTKHNMLEQVERD